MALELVLLLPFFFVGALLYSSVGHGGATVYLAILTLADYAVGPLTTTVLVLNILAAAIGFFVFRWAGHLRWRLLVPFVVTSVPMAYVGGRLHFSGTAQGAILGGALLLASLRFLLLARPPRVGRLPVDGTAFLVVAFLLGALLGFLAGVTGIGGGIFLSPILVALGWTDVRGAANVASAFIVLNSLAGLAAKLPTDPVAASFLVPLGAVVVLGAVLGSFAGARRLPPRALQVLLGLVLLVAAAKALGPLLAARI